MRTRNLLATSIVLALLSGAWQCSPAQQGQGQGGQRSAPRSVVGILAPHDGVVLDDCSVFIKVRVGPHGNPASLSVELNGEAIDVEPLSGPLYGATLPGGPPLQTSNTLVVTVERADGTPVSESVGFGYAPPEPRARRISSSSDLIGGPQGDGRPGDWLLENCQARFVVQDAPLRDLTGIGQYGGNLIDAELRTGVEGHDSFMELQPMLNIESVVNAEYVEIENDGSNGEAAVLRSCGPDDLIDYINANTLADELAGLPVFPPSANDRDLPLWACTYYALEAGSTAVEVTTEVENLGGEDLLLYVGDYINGSGELEHWTNDGDLLNASAGIGEQTATLSFEVLSYQGFGEAEGVDYSYVPTEFDGGMDTSSFTQSGVSVVLHSVPVVGVLFLAQPALFEVPAGGVNEFVRHFSVGDGSGNNAIELSLELTGDDSGTLAGCVTLGGEPARGARVVVGLVDGSGQIAQSRSYWVADADGCYQGRMPVGSYGVAASLKGALYEGGAPDPVVHPAVISSGATTTQDIALPATGRVQVTVVDESGQPIPARIGIVGIDPSPVLPLEGNLFGLGVDTATFFDQADPIPEGLTWVAYAGAYGVAEFALEPGSYDVVVSRGTEYSAHIESVTVAADPAPPTVVKAQIARVIDTSGFVSSDFHVHMLPSSDSRIRIEKRVLQFAGEGVDNIVATDHDRHTDLNPAIAELGLAPFVHATIGEEITSFDYGHFNAYPMGIDPDRITQGSTDWAIPAPIGQEYPSAGAFTGKPEEIFELIFTTQREAGGTLNDSPQLTAQVNHIDSHYSPLKINTALTPPSSQLDDDAKEARRFCSSEVPGSCAAVGELFFHYPALELWNGYTRDHALNEFLRDRIGIWANQLNQGLRTTAIYDTDTHEFFNTRAGGARSWTPSSSDVPSAIDDEEIGAAVKTGRVVGGQGLYVQARLFETAQASNRADFTLGGSTEISVPGGAVTLEIDIQAPLWAEYDRIEIYRNPTTTITGDNGGVPVLFTANPTEVLSAGADFTVETETVYSGVPGAQRFQTLVQRDYTLGEDSWFAVVVRGTDGTSDSMFPVMPASLSQGGVHAMGATNALYVDVDGGGFDPPGVSCTNCGS